MTAIREMRKCEDVARDPRPVEQQVQHPAARRVGQRPPHGRGAGLEAADARPDGVGRHTCNYSITYFRAPSNLVYALAKGAVEGDLGEGALENGELLVVQLGKE